MIQKLLRWIKRERATGRDSLDRLVRRRGGAEYAVMMDFSPRQRPLGKVELMLYGPWRGRPISREEWDFWNYHILPYGHIILGVPEHWKGLPPN